MFDRILDIYNANRGDKPRITKKILAERFEYEKLTTSYQYGRKLMDAVDSGKQLRINYRILKFTAELLVISMDELFNQFFN